MAKTGQKARKANPMTTKNGNPRLGPLNVAQLTKMLDGARKKEAPKIKNALARRLKTQQVSIKVVEEVVVAEIAQLVAEETLQATE